MAKDPATTGLPGGTPKSVPGGPQLPGQAQLSLSPFYKGSLPNQMKKGHSGGN